SAFRACLRKNFVSFTITLVRKLPRASYVSLASAVQHANKKDWQHLSREQTFHDPLCCVMVGCCVPSAMPAMTSRSFRKTHDRPEWQGGVGAPERARAGG